jgi:hypothetical protein
MDTLGFEPRAFRMRSGCDTTTPCAPLSKVASSAILKIHAYACTQQQTASSTSQRGQRYSVRLLRPGGTPGQDRAGDLRPVRPTWPPDVELRFAIRRRSCPPRPKTTLLPRFARVWFARAGFRLFDFGVWVLGFRVKGSRSPDRWNRRKVSLAFHAFHPFHPPHKASAARGQAVLLGCGLPGRGLSFWGLGFRV